MSARSHLRDSFRVVLFGLAVVFAASAELWAETLAVLPQGNHEIRITGPDEIELEFNAIRDADNVITRCSGNGLRGGIECGVNRRLDDSETLGGGRIQAKLRVQIPPEMRDGQNPEARLLVGPPVLTITGADPELERRIRQEAGRIMIGLSLWQDRLSRERLTTLREAGVMEAPIDSPFAALEFFANPEVALRWDYVNLCHQTDNLRVVVPDQGGAFREMDQLRHGVSFQIEAKCLRNPTEDIVVAKLSWDGCEEPLSIPLYRGREGQTVFRSVPLLFKPGPVPPVETLFESDRVGLKGGWTARYSDNARGRVTGTVNVTPTTKEGGIKAITATFRDPLLNVDRVLEAVRIEEHGDDRFIAVHFTGLMVGAGPAAQEVTLPASLRSVRLTVGERNQDVAISDIRLRLDLDLTNIERGVVDANWRYNFFPGERPFGRQRILDDSTGLDPATEEGYETWSRAPASLTSARTVNFQPSADPKLLGVAHVEFHGANLPVYRDSVVNISFDDDRYSHTGAVEAYWYEPTMLMAKVQMETGTPDGPVTVTINGASVEWTPDWNAAAAALRFVRFNESEPARPVDKLHWGEVFYVEAVYPIEQMMHSQTYQLGPADGPGRAITLTKRTDRPEVFRSPPILLLAPGVSPPSEAELAARRPDPNDPDVVASEFADGVETVIHHRLGTRLTLQRRTPVRFPEPRSPVAVVAAPPLHLFPEALEIARACYNRNPEAFEVSNIVLAGNLLSAIGEALSNRRWPRGSPWKIDEVRRSLKIEVEAHAATLLIRNEVITHLRGYRDFWPGANADHLELAGLMAVGKAHPKFAILLAEEVEGPFGTVPYRHAVRARHYFSRLDTSGAEVFDAAGFNAYRVQITRQALARSKVKIIGYLRDAQRIRDCDVQEMMKLTAWGVEPAIQSLVPKLFRAPSSTEPPQPAVLIDTMGRAHVRSVSTLVKALRAHEAYANKDTDATLFLASGFVTGGGYLLGSKFVAGLSAGFDISGLVIGGERWVAAHEDRLRSEGVAAVGGEQRVRQLVNEEREARNEFLTNLTLTGVMHGGVHVIRNRAAAAAAARQAHLDSLTAVERLRRTGESLASLSQNQRNQLRNWRASGRRKLAQGGIPDPHEAEAMRVFSEAEAESAVRGGARTPSAQPPGSTTESTAAADLSNTAPPAPPPTSPVAPPGGQSGGASTKILPPFEPPGSTATGPSGTQIFPPFDPPGHQTAGTATDLLPPFDPPGGAASGPSGTQIFPPLEPPGNTATGPSGTQIFSPLEPPGGRPVTDVIPPSDVVRGSRLAAVNESIPLQSPAGIVNGLRQIPASRLGPGALDLPWTVVGGNWKNFRISSPLGDLVPGPHKIQGGLADVHQLVHLDGRDSGFVVKFMNSVTGEHGAALRTQAQESASAFRGVQHGAAELSRHNVPQLEIQHWGNLAGGPEGTTHFVVQRGLSAHLPDGSKEVLLADLLRDGARLDSSIQNSVLDLFDAMQKRGLAGEDLSIRNIYVRMKAVDGADVPAFAGVLDQDRIAAVATSSVFDDTSFGRAMNWVSFQPTSRSVNSIRGSINILEETPEFVMKKMLERQRYIQYDRAQGRFVSEHFDLDVVCAHPGFRDLADALPPGWAAGSRCSPTPPPAGGASCPLENPGTIGGTADLPPTPPPGYSGGRAAFPPVDLNAPPRLNDSWEDGQMRHHDLWRSPLHPKRATLRLAA